MIKRTVWIIFGAWLVSACSSASPNAPLSQQYGTLNLIAVGVAVLGGLIGLALSRRKVDRQEPQARGKKQKNRERRNRR